MAVPSAEDWSALGFGSNPVPGDVDSINAYASTLGSKSKDLQALVTTLKNVQSNSSAQVFKGEAGDKFRSTLGDFPDEVNKFVTAIDDVSGYVKNWATMVQGHQDKAYAKAYGAEQKKKNVDSANTAYSKASITNSNLNHTTGFNSDGSAKSASELSQLQTSREAAQSQLMKYGNQLDDAQNALAAVKNAVQGEVDGYVEDARKVSGWIGQVKGGTPGAAWWEQVYYSQTWQVVVDVLEKAVAVLSLVLLLVPGLDILAGIIFAMSAVLFVNSLAKFAEGEETGKELVLDAVFLIFSGVTGGFKGVVNGVKSGVSGFRSLASAGQNLSEGIGAVRSTSGFVADAYASEGIMRSLQEGSAEFVRGTKSLAYDTEISAYMKSTDYIAKTMAKTTPQTLKNAVFSTPLHTIKTQGVLKLANSSSDLVKELVREHYHTQDVTSGERGSLYWKALKIVSPLAGDTYSYYENMTK